MAGRGGYESPFIQPRCRAQRSVCCIRFKERVSIVLQKTNNQMVLKWAGSAFFFFCELRTKFLCLIYMKFGLHCRPSNINFKISTKAQFFQCDQNFVTKPSLSRSTSQMLSSSPLLHTQIVHLLSSLSKALPCLQPTFIRRTNGRCPGTLVAVNSAFFATTNVVSIITPLISFFLAFSKYSYSSSGCICNLNQIYTERKFWSPGVQVNFKIFE